MISTYNKLEKIVLKDLEAYQTDLTNHDQRILTMYDGPFIYGWRRTGTDIMPMHKTLKETKEAYKRGNLWTEEETAQVLQEAVIWITGLPGSRNDKFLFFDGKELHRKTAEQINTIYKNHIDKVIRDAKMKAELLQMV